MPTASVIISGFGSIILLSNYDVVFKDLKKKRKKRLIPYLESEISTPKPGKLGLPRENCA